MQNAKKRTAKTQKNNARSKYIRIILCFLILGGFLYTLVGQQIRLASIRRETTRCEKEISKMEKEYERLSKKAQYSSSDEFYEEKARNEGYVREDETVFVIGN